MISRKLARRALCTGAVALALSSGVGGAFASAASGPKLVVTPSINLHNGEVVKVSGSGFKPGDSVYIVQCLVKAEHGSRQDLQDWRAP
jgi:hypothetical protein